MLRLLSRYLGGNRVAQKADTRDSTPVPLSTELSEEDEGPCQFLTDSREISDLLRGLKQSGTRARLAFANSLTWFGVDLLHCDEKAQVLLVRLSGTGPAVASAKGGSMANMVFEYKAARILFTLTVLGKHRYQEIDCLKLEWPSFGLHVQFRDSLRVALPGRLHVQLRLTLSGSKPVEVSVTDISEGGIGLLVDPVVAAQLTPGMAVRDAVLTVPDLQIDRLHLAIRHVQPLPSGKVFVGAQLMDVPEMQVQKIRRLIMQQQIASSSPKEP